MNSGLNLSSDPLARVDLRKSVTLATNERYNACLLKYDHWAAARDIPRAVLLAEQPLRTVSAVVVAYLQWALQAGYPASEGTYFLAALQHEHPHLRVIFRRRGGHRPSG